MKPSLLALILGLSCAIPSVHAAPALPAAFSQLQQQKEAGTVDFERDVQPLLAALNGRDGESQQWDALRLLCSLLGRDGKLGAEQARALRSGLAAQILAFAKQERFSVMRRDSALMLLRDIEADEAAMQAGIRLAEEESAKGRPHFGTTARLLRDQLQPRGSAGAGTPARTDVPSTGRRPAAPEAPDFHSQMLAAQQAMSAQDYPRVLQLVQGLEADLQRRDPKRLETVEWAWVFEFKRFALYEVGRIPEALATCRLAAERLARAADWPYLEEYNVVRSTRRACHNMLASDALDRAKSLADLQAAIQHIDQTFDISSPIEDESVHDNFYDTRLRIYLKAMSWDAKTYREPLYEALNAAEGREIDLPDDLPALDAVRRSPEYQRYRKEHRANAR